MTHTHTNKHTNTSTHKNTTHTNTQHTQHTTHTNTHKHTTHTNTHIHTYTQSHPQTHGSPRVGNDDLKGEVAAVLGGSNQAGLAAGHVQLLVGVGQLPHQENEQTNKNRQTDSCVSGCVR